MACYKKLFKDAKVQMDQRLRKEKIQDGEMFQLGKSKAKSVFYDIDEVVDEQLQDFLGCMNEPNLKPPFLTVLIKDMRWENEYQNPYYVQGLKQEVKRILENNIKEKIPKFCRCVVNIEEKIESCYQRHLGEWHKMKLKCEFELDFES